MDGVKFELTTFITSFLSGAQSILPVSSVHGGLVVSAVLLEVCHHHRTHFSHCNLGKCLGNKTGKTMTLCSNVLQPGFRRTQTFHQLSSGFFENAILNAEGSGSAI